MDALQPIAPGGEHEDPFTDAGQKGSSYVSLGLALTQRRVDSQIRRLGLQPRTDRSRDTARPKWAPMLVADEGRGRSTAQALDAWIAATPHRDSDRGARLAADRAERRLADLHPAAMSRYRELRRSLDPTDAMWVAASQLSSEPQPTPTAADQNTAASSVEVQTHESTIRDVFDGQLAGRVLADPSWPGLKEVLSQTERQGQAAVKELVRLAAGQRELGSARFPAKVLLHRIASETGERPNRPRASGPSALESLETTSAQPGSASYPIALNRIQSAAAHHACQAQPSETDVVTTMSLRSRHR